MRSLVTVQEFKIPFEMIQTRIIALSYHLTALKNVIYYFLVFIIYLHHHHLFIIYLSSIISIYLYLFSISIYLFVYHFISYDSKDVPEIPSDLQNFLKTASLRQNCKQ